MLALLKQNEENIEDKESFPLPPEELGFDAKCVWMRAGPKLFEDGLLNDGNLDLFHSYCMIMGEVRECEGMIAVDGKIVGGKKHPAFEMMLTAVEKAKNIYLALRPKGLGIKEEEREEKESGWNKDKGLLA